jgi:hypothetical protein
MTYKYINQVKDFIAQLELAEADPGMKQVFRPEAVAFQDDTSGAAVDAGSLVSFVSGLTAQHKSDVLNSALLAQLAANKKFERFKQTRQWYEFYTSVLANVGWVVPTFVYREYSPSGDIFIVSDAVIQILSAIATGDEMDILRTSLESLKDNPNNEGPLTLFENQSFPENLGNCQIFPVGEDDGQVVMAQAALEFRAEEHRSRFLWFTWKRVTVKLFQSSQKNILNEDIYGQVRETIIKKLGDNAKQFVHDIEI